MTKLKERREFKLTPKAAGFAIAILLAFTLLYWATGTGVTPVNIQRIGAGMPMAQVESILGPPNPLPDLRRKNAAFWDANIFLGVHYVSVYVKYDASGRVESTQIKGFWRWPPGR